MSSSTYKILARQAFLYLSIYLLHKYYRVPHQHIQIKNYNSGLDFWLLLILNPLLKGDVWWGIVEAATQINVGPVCWDNVLYKLLNLWFLQFCVCICVCILDITLPWFLHNTLWKVKKKHHTTNSYKTTVERGCTICSNWNNQAKTCCFIRCPSCLKKTVCQKASTFVFSLPHYFIGKISTRCLTTNYGHQLSLQLKIWNGYTSLPMNSFRALTW